MQNAQRMNEPLVPHVRFGAVFNRTHAGQHVAVCENNSFGIACGSGSEQESAAGSGSTGRNGAHLLVRQLALPVFKRQNIKCRRVPLVPILDRGTSFARSTASPITSFGFASAATRATNSAVPNASSGTASTPRSTQPCKAASHSALFCPQIRTRSPSAMPLCSSSAAKRPAEPRQLAIRRHAPAIPLVAHHRNLAVEAAKIVDDCGQVIAHFGGDWLVHRSSGTLVRREMMFTPATSRIGWCVL